MDANLYKKKQDDTQDVSQNAASAQTPDQVPTQTQAPQPAQGQGTVPGSGPNGQPQPQFQGSGFINSSRYMDLLGPGFQAQAQARAQQMGSQARAQRDNANRYRDNFNAQVKQGTVEAYDPNRPDPTTIQQADPSSTSLRGIGVSIPRTSQSLTAGGTGGGTTNDPGPQAPDPRTAQQVADGTYGGPATYAGADASRYADLLRDSAYAQDVARLGGSDAGMSAYFGMGRGSAPAAFNDLDAALYGQGANGAFGAQSARYGDLLGSIGRDASAGDAAATSAANSSRDNAEAAKGYVKGQKDKADATAKTEEEKKRAAAAKQHRKATGEDGGSRKTGRGDRGRGGSFENETL